MRKYRVLKSFTDKNTNVGYNAGSTFSSSDAERIAFLVSKGYLHAPVKDDFDSLFAQAKQLKIKGYTKMNEQQLREAVQAKKASEANATN